MNMLTSHPLPTAPSPTPLKTIKRSFDVAFLMAPDEKLLERRQEKSRLRSLMRRCHPQESWELAAGTPLKVTSSAFTKVTPPRLEIPLTTSPHSSSTSASPDQVYFEDSLSPSPTIGYPYTPDHMKSSPISSYLLKTSGLLSQGELLSKVRPGLLYPPSPEAMVYPPLTAGYPFTTTFPAPPVDLLRPATSLLSTAFALPAQNVCAKCNVSFRMTSDLVYHMRSHHKGESSGPESFRRRREQEKLKCPVCSESFRERHHLTRHMTAHQDKEGDLQEDK